MTSVWTIAIVGVLYTVTVITLLVEHQPWKALMFAGYVIGQVGILMDIIRPS